MHDMDQTIADLGNEPPLIADGRSGPPDRREVSARWLSGTFLTGVTSSVLMGVALFAALDGREQLAVPPEIAELVGLASNGDSGESAKTTRLAPLRQIAKAKDRRRMEVSMVTKVGDRDVIKTMPFVQIKMALAAGHTTTRSYPAFDPLAVFAEDGTAQTASATAGQIYGVKVESEMSLKTVDFPLDTASFDEKSGLSADEVEKVVRETGAILTDGAVQVAALHYIVPERFGDTLASQALNASYGVRIVPENVSVTPRTASDDEAVVFAEDIIPFNSDRKIAKAFEDAGYVGDDANGMAEAIAKLLNAPALKAGTVLRVGLEVRGEVAKVVRTSVYDRTTHLLSIALDDRGQFVPAAEPEPNPELLTAFDEGKPTPTVRGNLPTIYDGIYRTAYSYGMSKSMTQRLVKLLGYSKMHTGVDWAAPAGSPILAAGNGVVEKAGWAGGYGKQTIIRHANGYETSYNHQSRIGNGIKPGVRVRQGQVIGFVGTTGLSTGAHLHYELIVNKRKVDPMRVRLPVGKVLKGEQLDAFMREKTRIDELLKEEDDSLKMASANAKLGG